MQRLLAGLAAAEWAVRYLPGLGWAADACRDAHTILSRPVPEAAPKEP